MGISWFYCVPKNWIEPLIQRKVDPEGCNKYDKDLNISLMGQRHQILTVKMRDEVAGTYIMNR